MTSRVIKVETKPFDNQNPGTSGLRKKCTSFMQPHYTENFIQSIFSTIPEESRVGGTLVVGGDGRYLVDTATMIIIRMAAANKFKKLVVFHRGLASTPCVSYYIRNHQALAGILLTASHNPGGPDNDFGIKYNVANGGGAPDNITASIFKYSQTITSYYICPDLCVDVNTLHHTTVSVTDLDGSSRGFEVEVVDSTKEYVNYMESIFDLPKIKSFLQNGLEGKSPFKVNVDGRSGVSGPYLHAIYGDILGCGSDSLSFATPLSDFGGKHPDPNLTYAADFVEDMKKGHHDFGVAFDGDADRCMVLGKNGFFVSPSDSLAIITANAMGCIPYFQKHHKLHGAARSMPTSSALDKVVEVLNKEGIKMEFHEVPTGWKYFCNLMDAQRVDICGEESFGCGSSHIREKDGVWVSLAWLSILATHRVSVQQLVENHWKKFGRHYYTRYDYEGLTTEEGAGIMNNMKKLIESEVKGQVYDINSTGDKFEVEVADNYSYNDPVDGSVAVNQGYRLISTKKDRIVVRLSGTGSSGATVRVYIERFESDPSKLHQVTAEALEGLINLAIELIGVVKITGRREPTVIS